MAGTMRLATSLCFAMFTITGCVGAPSPGGGGGDDDGGNNGGGDDDGNNGGGGETMAPSQYLSAVGMTECDEAFACKANFPTADGPFEEVFGPNAAACYQDAAGYYDPAKVQSSIMSGKLLFDGQAAAACIAGIGVPVCATYWTQGPAYPEACDEVMTGKVADGGACTIDFECANFEAFCDETTAKCTVDPGGARAGRRRRD